MTDVKWLVRDLSRLCVSDGFIDGGDIQELLVKHGCMTLETVNEPCHAEDCLCAEIIGDFPTKCYRLTQEFQEKTDDD